MERRPPNEQGRNRPEHTSANFKDAKGALSKNDMKQGRGGQNEAHEQESNEDFLERMSKKLKKSTKDS